MATIRVDRSSNTRGINSSSAKEKRTRKSASISSTKSEAKADEHRNEGKSKEKSKTHNFLQNVKIVTQNVRGREPINSARSLIACRRNRSTYSLPIETKILNDAEEKRALYSIACESRSFLWWIQLAWSRAKTPAEEGRRNERILGSPEVREGTALTSDRRKFPFAHSASHHNRPMRSVVLAFFALVAVALAADPSTPVVNSNIDLAHKFLVLLWFKMK